MLKLLQFQFFRQLRMWLDERIIFYWGEWIYTYTSLIFGTDRISIGMAYCYRSTARTHTAAVLLARLVTRLRSELWIIERVASEWDSIMDRVDYSLLKGADRCEDAEDETPGREGTVLCPRHAENETPGGVLSCALETQKMIIRVVRVLSCARMALDTQKMRLRVGYCPVPATRRRWDSGWGTVLCPRHAEDETPGSEGTVLCLHGPGHAEDGVRVGYCPVNA